MTNLKINFHYRFSHTDSIRHEQFFRIFKDFDFENDTDIKLFKNPRQETVNKEQLSNGLENL